MLARANNGCRKGVVQIYLLSQYIVNICSSQYTCVIINSHIWWKWICSQRSFPNMVLWGSFCLKNWGSFKVTILWNSIKCFKWLIMCDLRQSFVWSWDWVFICLCFFFLTKNSSQDFWCMDILSPAYFRSEKTLKWVLY